MGKNTFLLFLLVIYIPSLLPFNQHIPLFHLEKTDKKPKFILKRMTKDEQQRLSAFIRQKLYAAKQEKNTPLINKYESMQTVLAQLTAKNLTRFNIQEEKIYTDYFNLIITELKSLGENPQLILHTTPVRQKLLEGMLEKTPWFVKEIAGLNWLFEQDIRQVTSITETPIAPKPLDFTQSRWPKLEDKALYVMNLVEQIERSHQRVKTDDLASIIEICQEYLISFLPYMSNIFKRTIQEALNKLEKVSNIRGIPIVFTL